MHSSFDRPATIGWEVITCYSHDRRCCRTMASVGLSCMLRTFVHILCSRTLILYRMKWWGSAPGLWEKTAHVTSQCYVFRLCAGSILRLAGVTTLHFAQNFYLLEVVSLAILSISIQQHNLTLILLLLVSWLVSLSFDNASFC